MAFVLLLLAGPALAAPAFLTSNSVSTIRHLSIDIGIRHAGSDAEHRTAAWLADQLRGLGYAPSVQPFPLPNGRQSQNVIAERAGSSQGVVIVGAHMDSKGPSPGANDNGSGVATVLELARILSTQRPRQTVRFIFFGSEEIINPDDPDGHHFGSRYYVAHMDRTGIVGMICIDSVANGRDFVIGNMQDDSPLATSLRHIARTLGYRVLDQTDPGWSDHEAFEKAGIPVAYVRWRVDDHLHSALDAFRYVVPAKITAAGRTTLRYLLP